MARDSIKLYFWLGIAAIALAFIINIFKLTPRPIFDIINANWPFIFGAWLVFDALDYKLNKNSLLTKPNPKLLGLLLIGGLLIGTVYEIYGLFIAGLWIAPFDKTFFSYCLGIVIGYGFPMFIYVSMQRILMKILPKIQISKYAYNPAVKKWMIICLPLAMVFFAIPIIAYQLALGWSAVSRSWLFAPPLIGMLLLTEYLNSRKRISLLERVFAGNFKSFVASIIGIGALAFVWERLNLLDPLWIYTNLPWAQIKMAGMPIVMMGGWVFLYWTYIGFACLIKKEQLW